MYLGNQPALSYTSFAKQDFTTSATTSYVLDNPVTNANELALFINFVRQEPTTAYSASGTSLTLTSATSASDDMYCVYLGKAVQTVNPPSGSVGISQLSATGTKDSTTFLRGDNTFASAGGTNTPAFRVTNSSSQSIPHDTWTKVTFDTEDYDTDSAFASSTFTVPSGKGGKYIFHWNVVTSIDANESVIARLYVNGAAQTITFGRSLSGGSLEAITVNRSVHYSLSAGNTVELYMYQNQGGAQDNNAAYTYFAGYKLIT